MRPIKFRAWHNEKRIMLFPRGPHHSVHRVVDKDGNTVFFDCADGPKDSIDWMSWTGLFYVNGRLQDVTFEQFTGLLDKNGKEIYEGDVLSNGRGRRAVVVWHKYTGQWDCKALNSDGDAYNLETWNWPYTEVIGNIHESPELIK